MSAEVFGTFPSPAKAEEAASRMEQAGFDSSEILVISKPEDFKSVVISEAEMNRSVLRGVYIGAILGFIIGIGIVIYSNSPMLNRWWGVGVIPLSQSLGWALFGMIAGSGGLLARKKIPVKLEHQLEKEVVSGKVLLGVQLRRGVKLDDIRAKLYEAGATDVRQTAGAAA